jgi:hypothetical protein
LYICSTNVQDFFIFLQENSKGPFRPERQQVDENEPYSHLQAHNQDQEPEKESIEENRTDSSEQEDTEAETTEDLGQIGVNPDSYFISNKKMSKHGFCLF